MYYSGLAEIINAFAQLDTNKVGRNCTVELVLIDKFYQGGVVVRKASKTDFDEWLVQWELVDILNGKVPAMIKAVYPKIKELHRLQGELA